MGCFPGVREFTNRRAFVEEIGQPFWHNATTGSYFQNFGWNVIGRTNTFHFEVSDEKLDFICFLEVRRYNGVYEETTRCLGFGQIFLLGH